MKMTRTLSCALAAALALVAGKASAQLVLSVSGSALSQKTYAGSNVATTGAYSLNEKIIYNIISNAVANAAAASSGTSPGAITPTNVPANGYIAFDPIDSDGGPELGSGFFYVTNKSGFYFPLSGLDTNGNYYSYIELDTQSSLYQFIGFQYGFVDLSTTNAPFDGVSSYNISSGGNGNGTEADHSTALLYIHDDPYAYDDSDSPSIYQNNYLSQGGGDDSMLYNNNAIEIRGIVTATQTVKSGSVTGGTFSLAGTGNLIYSKAAFPYGSLIQSAKATLTK
jgi:hypothetical protein